MANIYLEKIASTLEEDHSYAMGDSKANLFFKPLTDVGDRLKERGYDSSDKKIRRTFKNSREKLLPSIGKNLLASGAGGVLGYGAAYLSKVHPTVRPMGALIGSQVGSLAQSFHQIHDNVTHRFPARLKEEMLGGTYAKNKIK